MRFRTLGPTMRPKVASAVAIRVSSGMAGLARARPMRSSADDRCGRVELLAPGLDRVVAHGHLEGGLGVAARG